MISIFIKKEDPLHLKAHVDVFGLKPLSNAFPITHTKILRKTTTLVKCIHRYSHAPTKETVEMLSRSTISNLNMESVFNAIVNACNICSKSGQRLHS